MVLLVRVYLVQHARSTAKDEDPSRPLSDMGWQDIRKMGEYAKEHLGVHVEQIVHSSKLRAKQTAEVLAIYLHPANGAKATGGLEPLADPSLWRTRLAQTKGDVMIVGHLPHLSKLASLLLTGDKERELVAFQTGGIVCLERGENGQWSIQWMISRDLLP